MNGYLIPANSKKSLLIFGLFNKFDLILASVGVGITIALLLILPIEDLLWGSIAIAPGLITVFLVIPVPNYHNTLTFIKNVVDFFSERQKFVWKGWCVLDGTKETKK